MTLKGVRELLQTRREFSSKDLNQALNITNDYTAVVPFLQYPVPAARGSAHAIALSFPGALNSATVTPESVVMLVQGELEPIQAEVSVVDGNTIFVQPQSPLRHGRSDDDLVHIVVLPGVTMQDGRSFAGISYVVSAG